MPRRACIYFVVEYFTRRAMMEMEPIQPLRANARDTLLCLFIHGPTWDGNVPSKSGRDELVGAGLANRGKGYQWLTERGMALCFSLGFADEKERQESRRRQERRRLEAENAQLRRHGRPWQPIDTAPKDGTEILAWLSGNRTDQFNNRAMVVRHDGYSGWNFPGVGGLKASHWMPAQTAPDGTKFTGPAGYKSALCEHCGRQFQDHSEDGLLCPAADTEGKS